MRPLTRATTATLPRQAQPLLSGPAPEPGVVHIGVGAFHRAHQAVFTERAMAATGDRSWGIVAVAPHSPGVVDALSAQDGLFFVLERDDGRARVQAVNAISEAVHAPSAGEVALARLADERTRVITMTVTEKGYLIDPESGGLRDDELVRADLAAVGSARLPSTAIGLLALGLSRRAAGTGSPVTVVSCDNLTSNGRMLARVLGDFARRLPGAAGSELTAYLNHAVTFPAGMVDRIVPATTEHDRQVVLELTGVRDDATVVAEPFCQWVLEDRFAGDRPPWDAAGVEFVTDVTPYETAKLRLLNAAHSMTAYLGALAGYDTVAQAVTDPAIAGAVRAIQREAIDTIEAPPGWILDEYADAVLARFGNNALGHRCDQVAADGSQKLAVRVAPTLHAVRDRGDLPVWSLLLVAAWARLIVHGHDDTGRTRHVADPILAELRRAGGSAPDPAYECVRRAGLAGPAGWDAEMRAELARLHAALARHGAGPTARSLLRDA